MKAALAILFLTILNPQVQAQVKIEEENGSLSSMEKFKRRKINSFIFAWIETKEYHRPRRWFAWKEGIMGKRTRTWSDFAILDKDRAIESTQHSVRIFPGIWKNNLLVRCETTILDDTTLAVETKSVRIIKNNGTEHLSLTYKTIKGSKDSLSIISHDDDGTRDTISIVYDTIGRPIFSSHIYTLGDTTATYRSECLYDEQLNEMHELKKWSAPDEGRSHLRCSLNASYQPLKCKSTSHDGKTYTHRYKYDKNGIQTGVVIRKGVWVMRRSVSRYQLLPGHQVNHEVELQ